MAFFVYFVAARFADEEQGGALLSAYTKGLVQDLPRVGKGKYELPPGYHKQLLGLGAGDVLYHSAFGPELHNVLLEDERKSALLIYRLTTAGHVASLYSRTKKHFEQVPNNPQAPSSLSMGDVRWFAEEVFRGSVTAIELLFAETTSKDVFCSQPFQVLLNNRELFVTEVVVDNYIKAVEESLAAVDSCSSDSDRGHQLYLTFHRLSEVDRLLNKEFPKVKAEGDLRSFLLRVRQGPYTGEFSVSKLQEKGSKQLKSALEKRLLRDSTFPADIADKSILLDWLIDSVYNLVKSPEVAETQLPGSHDLVNALLSPIRPEVTQARDMVSTMSSSQLAELVEETQITVAPYEELKRIRPHRPRPKKPPVKKLIGWKKIMDQAKKKLSKKEKKKIVKNERRKKRKEKARKKVAPKKDQAEA